jgi:hypothetical protein
MEDAPTILLSGWTDRPTVDSILHDIYGPVPTYSGDAILASPVIESTFIWYDLTEQVSPGWPACLNFFSVPARSTVVPYVYVLIAEALFDRHGLNSLCMHQDYVTGLNRLDPYWSLSYWQGLWYLADDSTLEPDDDRFDSPPHVTLFGPMERKRFLDGGYSRDQLPFAFAYSGGPA